MPKIKYYALIFFKAKLYIFNKNLWTGHQRNTLANAYRNMPNYEEKTSFDVIPGPNQEVNFFFEISLYGD